jgi:two-component system, OmpR family, alkaline phosphatase synthesis response regulator PhoP
MTHKILVVEDEPTLAKLLTYNLKQEGFETIAVENGRDGLNAALQQSFDLIFLDIMLPGMSGFEVLAKLREQGSRTPIIILTARNAEEEVVQGLKLGADDYITKPFGVAELLARTIAVLRRSQTEGYSENKPKSDEHAVIVGDLQVYPKKYEAYVDGHSIALRPKEFEMLLYLAERPGVVVTRDDLMNIVWGFDYFGGQRTVDVHVSSLRKKLETSKQSVQIESIRGVGYKLVVSGYVSK